MWCRPALPAVCPTLCLCLGQAVAAWLAVLLPLLCKNPPGRAAAAGVARAEVSGGAAAGVGRAEVSGGAAAGVGRAEVSGGVQQQRQQRQRLTNNDTYLQRLTNSCFPSHLQLAPARPSHLQPAPARPSHLYPGAAMAGGSCMRLMSLLLLLASTSAWRASSSATLRSHSR